MPLYGGGFSPNRLPSCDLESRLVKVFILLHPGVRDAAKKENRAQVQVRNSVKVPYWFDGVVKGWWKMSVRLWKCGRMRGSFLTPTVRPFYS